MTITIKQLGILLFLSLILLKIPSSPAETFSITHPNIDAGREHKIVGGYRCPIEKYPFLVSLRHVNSDHFCAGTLLSKFWVLTAWHCLVNKCHQRIVVVAGANISDRFYNYWDSKVQYASIAHCYFYPIANVKGFDIALARLKSSIVKASNVGYVKLPFRFINGHTSLTHICSNSTVLGWGLQYECASKGVPVTLPIPEYDAYLQCVHLPVISQEECASRNNVLSFPIFFCTYQPHQDACYGDSGGPLMCNGYQYGIVSRGFGCAYNEHAGVYTKITYFKDFIRNTINSEIIIDDKNLGNAIRAVKLSTVLLILVLQCIVFVRLN